MDSASAVMLEQLPADQRAICRYERVSSYTYNALVSFLSVLKTNIRPQGQGSDYSVAMLRPRLPYRHAPPLHF